MVVTGEGEGGEVNDPTRRQHKKLEAYVASVGNGSRESLIEEMEYIHFNSLQSLS